MRFCATEVDAGADEPSDHRGAGECFPPHCFNDVKDADETDVNCGGPCPGCDPGGSCNETDDCDQGLACFGGVCADCTSNPDAPECQPPGHCENGIKDADETGVDCGGSCPGCDPGGPCDTNDDCRAGLACIGGTCSDCTLNPGAPVCEAPGHCSNGATDGDETGVDCGGSCPGCVTGGGCRTNADCSTGHLCGANNGACFGGGRARADRVCWPALCEDEVREAGECGQPDSPCGQNCACANACDTEDPNSTCPENETCQRGFGTYFNLLSRDACAPGGCPTDNPALCGGPFKLCGDHCYRPPSCAAATCENPGDGAGGICPVCDPGDECTDDFQCKPGYVCLEATSGVRRCRPAGCRLARLV